MINAINKKLRSLSISFWVMLYCLLSYTLFQYIPIYFTNHSWCIVYYPVVSMLLLISVGLQLLYYIKRNGKVNYYWSIPWSIILFIVTFVFSAFFILGSFLDVWTEAGTYYVSRSNHETKIIRRYIDEGAFGGGTEPDDYSVVLHRPVTPWFKLETAIDTNKIDKTEWVKPGK